MKLPAGSLGEGEKVGGGSVELLGYPRVLVVMEHTFQVRVFIDRCPSTNSYSRLYYVPHMSNSLQYMKMTWLLNKTEFITSED